MEGCSSGLDPRMNNLYLTSQEICEAGFDKIRSLSLQHMTVSYAEKITNKLCTIILNKSQEAADLGSTSAQINKIEFKSCLEDYKINGKTTEIAGCGSISEVINSILFKNRGVNCLLIKGNEEDFNIKISWDQKNPYLNPKPVLPPVPTSLSYGEEHWKLYINKTGTDVKFLVGEAENEEIAAHKFPLLVSPVLYAMFMGPMKEATSNEPINFPYVYSKEAFEELMRHLYTRKVDESFLKDANKTLDLFMGANALQIEALKAQCAHSLGAMISVEMKKPQVVLDIAIASCATQHEGLMNICKWFFKINPQFYEIESLLKDKSLEEILTIIDTAHALGYNDLKKICYQNIKQQISLQNFKTIAERTVYSKDKVLQEIGVSFIKANEDNYNYIYNHRKNLAVEEWGLYKTLSLVPEGHKSYVLANVSSVSEDYKDKDKGKDKEKP